MSRFTVDDWLDAERQRRFGKFRIDRRTIKAHPHLVAHLFGQTVVVRAELMFEYDATEYTAISPHFAPRGSMLVEYGIELEQRCGAIVAIRFAVDKKVPESLLTGTLIGRELDIGGRDDTLKRAAGEAAQG